MDDPTSPQAAKISKITDQSKDLDRSKFDRRSVSEEEYEEEDASLEPKSEDEEGDEENIPASSPGKVEIKEADKKDEDDDDKSTEIPLMKDDTVHIDVKLDGEGEDTPTLPLKKKNSKEIIISIEPHKKNPPMYLFPITRMKLAWTNSSNICDFFFKAILIIFTTLGWMFCIGGVPFVSLAMLIIGSIYIDDCKVQPNIPIYLIVSGVFGTIQHFISIWTKYVPKNSQGRLKVYRAYCNVIDGVMSLFLTIWFVLGCIWVYGVKEVEYKDTYKDEYCHKTLYLFAFWILNFSFIVLSLLMVLSLCCILCIVKSAKDVEKGIVQ